MFLFFVVFGSAVFASVARMDASTQRHLRSLRKKLPSGVLAVECLYVGNSGSVTYWRIIWMGNRTQIVNGYELRQMIDQEALRRQILAALDKAKTQ